MNNDVDIQEPQDSENPSYFTKRNLFFAAVGILSAFSILYVCMDYFKSLSYSYSYSSSSCSNNFLYFTLGNRIYSMELSPYHWNLDAKTFYTSEKEFISNVQTDYQGNNLAFESFNPRAIHRIQIHGDSDNKFQSFEMKGDNGKGFYLQNRLIFLISFVRVLDSGDCNISNLECFSHEFKRNIYVKCPDGGIPDIFFPVLKSSQSQFYYKCSTEKENKLFNVYSNNQIMFVSSNDETLFSFNFHTCFAFKNQSNNVRFIYTFPEKERDQILQINFTFGKIIFVTMSPNRKMVFIIDSKESDNGNIKYQLISIDYNDLYHAASYSNEIKTKNIQNILLKN